MKHEINVPVRRQAGIINLALCLAAAEEAFASLKQKEEKIPGAVAQFFEQNEGLKHLNMKALVTGVVVDHLDFSDIKDLTARLNARVEAGQAVEDYVRSNTDMFYVAVGRQKNGQGSVRYIPRLDAAEQKEVSDLRAKAAAEEAAETSAQAAE